MLTSLLVTSLFGSAGGAVAATPTCLGSVGQWVSMEVASVVYGQPVPVKVYLPPCYEPARVSAYPVIYLLHGANADETQWPDLNVQAAAERLLAEGERPFIVVMPGGAYYGSIDYGAFVVNDLLPSLAAHYRVRTDRMGRALGGLSLGGYWALKIAFSHPDLFAAVGGNSPVVTRGAPDDPLPLAQAGSLQALKALPVALDAGNFDSLRFNTQALAEALRAGGVPVSFVIGHGGHERAYWRSQTYSYFTFYLQAISPRPGLSCGFRSQVALRC